MSPAAEAVLLAYYQMQRRSEDRSAARTTIRLLESLVRLAQVKGLRFGGGAFSGEGGVRDSVCLCRPAPNLALPPCKKRCAPPAVLRTEHTRATQAHARLLARAEVTLQDAVIAVTVADASMSCAALLGPINAMHTHFPEVQRTPVPRCLPPHCLLLHCLPLHCLPLHCLLCLTACRLTACALLPAACAGYASHLLPALCGPAHAHPLHTHTNKHAGPRR